MARMVGVVSIGEILTRLSAFAGLGKNPASLRKSCLKFQGVFLLLAATAFAQEVPNAIHVREKIDQEVEFQDTVVAVSYSRTSEGYYLSFGAPFPAQILSVWVDRKDFSLLPANDALVGRVVRIRGKIETSSTGPLLKLKSPDEFQLLPVKEVALTKEVLDGKMDRDQFQAAARQKFAAEDFATLEVLAEELRQSHERFSDGTWISAAFYDAFEIDSHASAEEFERAGQSIAHWEAASPGSLVPLLVKARWHHDLAWKARTHKSPKHVTPEGRAGFRRELTEARDLLESHPAAKMYPEYFAILLKIASCQKWKKEDYMRLFAEATNSEPDYYTFYFQAAHSLSPYSGGREGEWQAFAEAQRQRRGVGAAGDALYARIAWSMQRHFDFEEGTVSWPAMASGFDFLLRERPQSRWLKNAYAYFAWQAKDRERLRKLLPEIRNDPDMNTWVNLENLSFAERLVETGR